MSVLFDILALFCLQRLVFKCLNTISSLFNKDIFVVLFYFLEKKCNFKGRYFISFQIDVLYNYIVENRISIMEVTDEPF